MKTVVHILTTGSFSGAENVVITILNQLKKDQNYRGIYVSLDGEIKDYLEEYGLEYYFLDKVSIKNLKKMISDLKPDILHCHDFTTSILTALTCTKLPIVSHLHNNPLWIKSKNIKSLAYRACLNKFEYVLGVSGAIFKEYIYSNKIKKKVVVSNPIDLSMINANDLEKKYDLIFLGRLTEQKDPLNFIRIVASLKKQLPDIKAVMVGNGDLYDECQKMVIENELSQNIDLVGFKKNRFDYIQSSKVMCITSKWEGFGLMAIEGLALKKPIASSTVGGLDKIITDNCGKRCMNNDDYVCEIYKLLTNKEYYLQKSKGALDRAKEIENVDAYMNRLKEIYMNV